MKLDFKSLAFGYSLTSGVSTPAWETSLGQGVGYKLNNLTTIDELVKGMVYKAVAPKTISFKKGRRGTVVRGDADNASLVIAAVFDKVFVNEHQIHGGKFVLLIVKDDAESHRGRLKLKYGLDNAYTDSEGNTTKNRDFHSIATAQLGMTNDACWFVYDMSVEGQDVLRLRTIIVNKDGSMTYANNAALHSAWDELIKNDMEVAGISDESEEVVGDIFSGFQPWLTSYDNPDYTGKQKYSWYSQALIRLVSFMEETGLIDDTNLNDKNIEKYYFFLEVYNSSEEVREYDEKKLSSKAGGAALKKYIKYIEYLLSPHAEGFDYATTAGAGENKIFFGTPGCGKSYHIEHKILGKTEEGYTGTYRKENIVRTTFYQDYSNTDFVGQILPKVVRGNEDEKDTVEYIFNPGPFTLALIQAISNPGEKVALVIEEINRGNAPAIFGDIFQLLDRDINSISEYGIVNVSLMDYLNNLEFVVNGQKKKYIFTEIKIPGNMDIFATMNTSDQNVYTLDTAFIRRWEKEKIKNTFAQCTFATTAVPGMPNYTWKEFVDGINGWIAKHLEDLQVNEDKQIGVFFVKESLLTSGDAEKFAFKVFDYLWSDVAKLDHGIFFNPFDTLEDLIDDYKTKGVGVFKPGIFEVKPVTLPQSEANNEQ